MTLLGIEKTLQQHPNESGKNFYNTYSVLLERLLQYEYTQTSAEFDGGNCHGPGHIRRVLKKLDELLGDQPLEHLGIFDLWVTMMATIYHDVGLLRGREGHPQVSQEFMLEEKNSYIFDSHERDLIGTAIFTHGGAIRIEEKCKKYPKRLKIGDFTVNSQRICALVRLADELDEDYRRGDEELFRMRQIAEKYPTSAPYWIFNQRTRGVYIDPPSSHRREVQIQMALHRNDLTYMAPVHGGGVISFVDFTINKLRKINAERIYCNEFLPEALRLTHMSLLLLPISGCEDLWDIPKEIPINDNDTNDDLRARLPAALTRTLSIAVPAPNADHTAMVPAAATTTTGLPVPEGTDLPSSSPSPPETVPKQPVEIQLPVAANPIVTDSKKKLTSNAPVEEPSDTLPAFDAIDIGSVVSLSTLPILPQHVAVRSEEREGLKSAIERNGIAWVIAEWGLGGHEFLGSCFADIANEKSVEVIKIECEYCATFSHDRLIGFSLDAALARLTKMDCPLPQIVLLDHIPTDNMSLQWEAAKAPSESLVTTACEQFAEAVRAAFPSMQIVMIARWTPRNARFPVIDLESLDEADCKRYIASHRQGSAALAGERYFNRIYSKSDGIPIYIDRVFDDMESMSVEDALEVAGEALANEFRPADSDEKFFRRSVVRALAQLQNSDDEHVRRSIKLLKSLTVLSYGETFGMVQRLHFPAIKRIDQTKPFYRKNVELLQALGLLKVASVVDVETAIKNPSADAMALSPKLLFVPMQLREYFSNKLLTEDEHRVIACSAMDVFFGDKWRDGMPSVAWVTRENAALNSPDHGTVRNANPRAVIAWLLRDSIRGTGPVSVGQILVVSELYLATLQKAGRFRDIRIMCDELVRMLDGAGHFDEASRLSHRRGYALRMLHEYVDAVSAQERALNWKGRGVSNDWRAQIHLELAETNVGLKNQRVAASHAEEALRLVRPESGSGIHAQEILIRVDDTLDDAAAREQLKQLESKARKKKHVTIANNIALRLADSSNDPAARLKLRNRVISTERYSYNGVRAAVAVAADMLKHGRKKDLAEYNRRLLNSAYSYLHEQRLSLFDKCHDVLWELEKSQQNIAGLTRICELSGALWRSTGKSAQEIKYFAELQTLAPQHSQIVKNERGFFSLSLSFFVGGLFRRLRSALIPVPA